MKEWLAVKSVPGEVTSFLYLRDHLYRIPREESGVWIEKEKSNFKASHPWLRFMRMEEK